MQRGQAIVLVALMMSVLLGFVALGIDSGRAFDTRRALQDAVDAAALTAADYYANSGSAPSSATFGAQLFAKELRLYPTSDASCSGLSSPAQGQTVSAACTVASPATLTVFMTAQGALGQTFTYDAHYSISLAMMQVLGLNPSVTLQAKASATSGDQTLSPSVGVLGGCASTTVSVTSSSPVYIFGDIVSNGGVSADPLSSVKVAGNLMSRCGAAVGPWSYACWQSTPPNPWAAPITVPCSTPGTVVGSNLIGAAFTDPALPAPPLAGLGSQAWPNASPYGVVAQPGIYANDPNISPLPSNSNPCYFLAPGVYQFMSGITVRNGLLSNELRPPDANDLFWAQGSPAHAQCAGEVAVNAVTPQFPMKPLLPSGTWFFKVTSIRTDSLNGATYSRESVPTSCHLVAIGSGQAASFVISNVPGAQGYNVYAAPPNGTATCPSANAFGFVQTFNICPSGSGTNCAESCPSSGLSAAYCQSNSDTSKCPNTNVPQNPHCTLGQASFTVDGNVIPGTWTVNPTAPAWTAGAPMPTGAAPAWRAGPTLAPAKGGDFANVNLCSSPSGPASAPYRRSTCPGTVVPGGVVIFVSGGCYTVQSQADSFIFSGPQYNWVAVHKPASNTCSPDSLSAYYNSAFEGSYYAPASALTIVSPHAIESPLIGGIAVKTLNVSNAGGLTIPFDPSVAPFVPAARLTG